MRSALSGVAAVLVVAAAASRVSAQSPSPWVEIARDSFINVAKTELIKVSDQGRLWAYARGVADKPVLETEAPELEQLRQKLEPFNWLPLSKVQPGEPPIVGFVNLDAVVSVRFVDTQAGNAAYVYLQSGTYGGVVFGKESIDRLTKFLEKKE